MHLGYGFCASYLVQRRTLFGKLISNSAYQARIGQELA